MSWTNKLLRKPFTSLIYKPKKLCTLLCNFPYILMKILQNKFQYPPSESARLDKIKFE